jgi:hypothetical protein
MMRKSQRTKMMAEEAVLQEPTKDLHGTGKLAQDLGEPALGNNQVNGTKEDGPISEEGGVTRPKLCYSLSSVSSAYPLMTNEID